MHSVNDSNPPPGTLNPCIISTNSNSSKGKRNKMKSSTYGNILLNKWGKEEGEKLQSGRPEDMQLLSSHTRTEQDKGWPKDITPPSQVLYGLQTVLSSLTFSHSRSISTVDEAKGSSKWRDGNWFMAAPFHQALLLHRTSPTCQTYTSGAQALQKAPCPEARPPASYLGRAHGCHDRAVSLTSCHVRSAGWTCFWLCSAPHLCRYPN